YYIKQAWYKLLHFHITHYLRPKLKALGENPFIVKPWHIEVFGRPVSIGHNITLLGCSDKKTRLTVWSDKANIPGITIGDHVLISPGVRISAAHEITIGDSCMLASNAYITDSDWHGIYDRSLLPDPQGRVVLEENVWIGDSAIVCKDVTIGKNSIIGAGAVVTSDIPANVIAAGNPARVIRELDPDHPMVTRKDRYGDTEKMNQVLSDTEKDLLKGNSLWGWIRSLVFPKSA
ncbi:MAG: acyltransferase, partial [Desulfobacterales bacterium]|nr:acyltransferase [Desulfobacterales bacterium]